MDATSVTVRRHTLERRKLSIGPSLVGGVVGQIEQELDTDTSELNSGGGAFAFFHSFGCTCSMCLIRLLVVPPL